MPVITSSSQPTRKFVLIDAAPRPAMLAANLIVHRSPGILIAALIAGDALAPLTARCANQSISRLVTSPSAALILKDFAIEYWQRQFWVSSPTSMLYASGLLAAVADGVNVHVLSAAPPTPVLPP